MNTAVLIKSMNAGAIVRGRRFVAVGAADFAAIEANAAAIIIGVSTEYDAAIADQVDVVMVGIAEIVLGGVVARGTRLGADANGAGVAVAPATGINANVGGFALASGVAGDIIPVLIQPHIIQGQ